MVRPDGELLIWSGGEDQASLHPLSVRRGRRTETFHCMHLIHSWLGRWVGLHRIQFFHLKYNVSYHTMLISSTVRCVSVGLYLAGDRWWNTRRLFASPLSVSFCSPPLTHNKHGHFMMLLEVCKEAHSSLIERWDSMHVAIYLSHLGPFPAHSWYHSSTTKNGRESDLDTVLYIGVSTSYWQRKIELLSMRWA